MVSSSTQVAGAQAASAVQQSGDEKSRDQLIVTRKTPSEVLGEKVAQTRRVVDEGSPLSQAVESVREDIYVVEGILKDGGLEYLKSALKEKVASITGQATGQGSEQAAGLAEYKRQGDPAMSGGPSPEAAAEGVASEALNQFPSFRQQNPGLSGPELHDRFANVLRERIDEGFDQTREIFSQANVLTQAVDDNLRGTQDALRQQIAAALGEL